MKTPKWIAAAGLGIVAAGSALLFATSANAAATATVTVTPSSGLTNGQAVTVKGSNYKPNLSLFITECAKLGTQSGCDITNLGTAKSDASGDFTATFHVKTGTIGDGTCGAGKTCYIAASDAGQTSTGYTTITFAGAATSSSAAPSSSPAATSASTGSGSAAPTAVSAGSGGHGTQAGDDGGVPVAVVVLGVAGLAALAYGGVRLSRR